MSLFTKDTMSGLQKLYIEELRDLYSAETQIVQALPLMIASATRPELQEAFQMHLEETQNQVQRLEKIFAGLKENPAGKVCRGMNGIIGEGQELIKQKAPGVVLDAGLISAAQRVEHYEMAGYGAVRTYANLLGFDDHAELLQQTLDEEGEADEKLTALAEGLVNQEAANA